MHRSRAARARRLRAFAAACLLSAAGSCAVPEPPLSAADAEAFLVDAEARLVDLWSAYRRAAWIDSRYATEDTAVVVETARRERLDGMARLAHAAARFDAVELAAPLRRKLWLLRTASAAVGPASATLQQELSEVLAGMRRAYDRSASCTVRSGVCLDPPALERLFAESRETDERLDAWLGWLRAAAPGRPAFRRFVELANAGAGELGFRDTGILWRAAHDLPPDTLTADVDRVWDEVRPLYESLHCHVRARLGETYGTAVVPPDGTIPAHLLGSPWAGRWDALYDLVRPRGSDPGDDLTRRLEQRRVDTVAMARLGEDFFGSLGFDPLPATFWERSLLAGPAVQGSGCRAGAWQIDAGADVRLRMCPQDAGNDFVTVHAMLGRAHHQWAYRRQDPLFRSAAAAGLEVAVAGAIRLSMNPDYFVRVGVLDRAPETDVGALLRQALDAVAHVPFGLALDRWRWAVFSGEVEAEAYNRRWWELRSEYQGVGPAVPRGAAAFDPGAAAAVAGNEPLLPGVMGRILQFQLHRALCRAAGVDGPLHRCAFFESPEAGARLRALMELGASRPWPDALEMITGKRGLDAGAMLEYFRPLASWLDAQNEGRRCGWTGAAVTSGGSPAAPPRA